MGTATENRRIGAYKSAAKKTGCTLNEWLRKRAAGLLWCMYCRDWRMSTQFSNDKSRRAGRASKCKSCSFIDQAASRYKTTKERIVSILSGPCEICGATNRKMHIDHDHKTGLVRGGLCSPCNRALGLFGDSVEVVRKAASYLDGANG